MSSYINTFLKTELTCIPQFLHTYAGDYYNNTLSNAATWLFFIWCALHCAFNSLFTALFKKMGCKSYINERLTQSLWYLGFYSTALVYCGASLTRSEYVDFSYRVMLPENRTSSSNDFVVGFLFLITFYAHTTVWETFVQENFMTGLSYLLLVLATLAAHYMKSVETAFGLSAVISAAHVGIELARIVQVMGSYDSKTNRLFSRSFFCLSLLFMLIIYGVALPVSILFPLIVTIISEPSTVVIIFIVFALTWLAVEVVSSPIYRLAEHWIFHMDTEKSNPYCPSCFAECALFLPRDDVVFNLKIYRQQMKEKQEKMISLRRPKHRNVFVQTLKCMVAIRKKMHQKRLSESSDSDDSERSEGEPKVELEIKEANSESEEESDAEQDENENKKAENENGVVIKEVTDEEAEDVVDGKLQIRVRERKEVKEEE